MALLGNVPPTDYQILVSIHEQRPAADLYAFTLREPLPTLPLPLKPGDEPISLALQTVFEGVYRRGRYQTRIDYSQNPPPPALPEADRQWLNQLLGQQSLR